MIPFIVPMENTELDRRFSTEDRLVYERDLSEEEFPFSYEEVNDQLSKLPTKEADMLYLYFFLRKDQTDIGEIFGITQGDVSYRLKRAIQRIKFLLSIPNIEEDQMRSDLRKYLPSDEYVEIMVGMYKTTSQSVVARQISLTQGKVRYRFLKGINVLKKHLDEPNIPTYVEVFEKVRANFNILNELNTGLEKKSVKRRKN